MLAQLRSFSSPHPISPRSHAKAERLTPLLDGGVSSGNAAGDHPAILGKPNRRDMSGYDVNRTVIGTP